MKLIECYIENFGKLSSYRLKFNDGMNSFVQENGYGKTTLTEFIKAMLYGLSDTKKPDIAENDRKHYLPWCGGVCGGWLSFSAGEKSYRVERTFGAKAQDDTFKIYDLTLGKETADYTENLGRELFGIDKDGFLRTVFLSERNLSGKNENKSISEKLSDTTGVDYDLGAMDDALKLLDERRKFYYKRGGSGEISSAEAELKAHERELAALDGMRSESKMLFARLSEINSETKKLTEKRIEVQGQIEQLGRQKEEQLLNEHYKRLAEENARKKARLAELDSFFKNGIPTQAQIRDASMAKIRSEELFLTDAAPKENEKLKELSERFGTTSKEAISSAASRLENAGKLGFFTLPLFLSLIVTVIGFAMIFIDYKIALIILPIGIFAAVLSMFIVKNHKKSLKIPGDIQLLLSSFGYQSNAIGIQKLLGQYTEFELLKSNEDSLMKKRATMQESAREFKEIAESFLSLYPTASEHPFDEISAMLNERAAILKTLSDFSDTVVAFPKSTEPAVFEQDPNVAMQILVEKQALLDSERIHTERRLSVIEAELEREDLIVAAIEDARSKAELYRKNLFLLQRARDFLSSARESMTSRYLGKAKAAFDKYISLFTEESSDYILDTSFEISKSEYGTARKSETYSLGVRNMQYLATRLAITDALYENEAPFLIFDDPFVSFDDKRTARAVAILKELSKKRQIIYFTCSASRKIQ